nr:HD domain-containing protein [Desulfobulbaceae bacterium]
FLSPSVPLVTKIVLFALFSLLRYATEKRRAYIWFQRLAKAQRLTLESMATVAETRDPETGAHLQRTQHFVKALAEHLRDNNIYTEMLDDMYIKLLVYSAPLHDIGKVGVPDVILTKPGNLTTEEFEQIKKHTLFGEKVLARTARKIEGDNFLELAREIAATHHEKWDRTGYP